MVRLIVSTVAGSRAEIERLARAVFDEIHGRLRMHGMEIPRLQSVLPGSVGARHVLPIDPPAAGSLGVECLGGDGGGSCVAFELSGVAAVLLAGALRDLVTCPGVTRLGRESVVTLEEPCDPAPARPAPSRIAAKRGCAAPTVRSRTRSGDCPTPPCRLDPRQWDEAVEAADGSRESARARLARHRKAVAGCRRCPVLVACRRAVAADPAPSGVWAGRVYRTDPDGRVTTCGPR